ncbi:MAG: 3-dehydroquinate synthase [Sphingomonadales bacterium]
MKKNQIGINNRSVKSGAMKKNRFTFSSGSTDCYFLGSIAQLDHLADPATTVVVTDQHVYRHHRSLFAKWNTIVLRAGERYKIQATVDALVERLVSLQADRSTTLVGVGGGVVTDLVGYTAAIYMRGIRVGFVPTTLLAMVDAAIGGKNGVDVGVYKNLVGTIRQPSFLLYDMALLKTLPLTEWKNGFAEIIKHAAILDAKMFASLERRSLSFYQKNKSALALLIAQNAKLKIKVVQADEQERGRRKWLNFGHTLGHALENQYQLSHGQAISLGMVMAARLSAHYVRFTDTSRLESLLSRYGLPTEATFHLKKTISILRMDKKKQGDQIDYVLVKKIGSATVHSVAFDELEKIIAKRS